MGELNRPLSQEEKRAVMISRLDSARDNYLKDYFKYCDTFGEQPDLIGLMENGMGLGAADLYDDDALDVLIAVDVAKAKKNPAT